MVDVSLFHKVNDVFVNINAPGRNKIQNQLFLVI